MKRRKGTFGSNLYKARVTEMAVSSSPLDTVFEVTEILDHKAVDGHITFLTQYAPTWETVSNFKDRDSGLIDCIANLTHTLIS